jgi:hypothetical protein
MALLLLIEYMSLARHPGGWPHRGVEAPRCGLPQQPVRRVTVVTDNLSIEELKAISARLTDRASEINQITLRGLADDLRLAARIAEQLAALLARTEE